MDTSSPISIGTHISTPHAYNLSRTISAFTSNITYDASSHSPLPTPPPSISNTSISTSTTSSASTSNLLTSIDNPDINLPADPDYHHFRPTYLSFKRALLITIPHIALFATLTIHQLHLILAYLFTLNVSHINLIPDTHRLLIEDVHDTTHHLLYILSATPSRHPLHLSLIQPSENVTFTECTSIGFTPFTAIIHPSRDTRLNNYETIFYKDYFVAGTYLHRILSNFASHSITTYPIHPNVTSLTITLVYTGHISSHSNVNIGKLFNMHHVGSPFSKIYIHSNDVDNYQSNPRPMMYVKTSTTASNVFKGVAALFNTCSLYWGLEIEHGITLQRIDISSNMNINITFTNINHHTTYHDLVAKVRTWLDTYLISKVLRTIKISECIYNIDFRYDCYIPVIASSSMSINVPNTSVADIDAVNELMLQYLFNVKFKARTSIQINGCGFWTPAAIYNFMYLNNIHEYITHNIVFKDLLPTIHVGMNSDTDLTITLTDCPSYDNAMYLFGYILGLFANIHRNITPPRTAKGKGDDTTSSSPSSLSLEEIRRKCSRYKKNLLGILLNADPNLFGSRKVGKASRSFSGLCQKHRQRVVPITAEEYEYLHTVVPDSVVNIRNQTYPNKRLYLFCPYTDFPFLNYHIFPNQLCIIRCTTKPSNRTQYNYCATSLDAEHVSAISNRYENQTITLYNPLITRGRKCRLPDELKMVLINFILLKLNTDVPIYRYCLNTYGKHPFIIRRDPFTQTYAMLTEYNADVDYVLLLQSDMKDDDYFIFLNEDTNEPLTLSANADVKKLFVDNMTKTESQYDFFNFVARVLNADLNKYYDENVKTILQMIRNEYDVKYVVNRTYVYGILAGNKLYMTPKLYWRFEDNVTYTIVLHKVLEAVIHGGIDLPSVDEFDVEDVKVLYRDWNDRKVHVVGYHGVSMLVQPFEVTAKWSDKDVIIFDSKAVMMNIFNLNIPVRKDTKKRHQVRMLSIGDVLKNYMYIFMMQAGTINIGVVQNILTQLNVINNGPTYIVHVDKSDMFVSWRMSRINRNDFMEFFSDFASMTLHDNIKTIYMKFQEELEFRLVDGEMIMPKIITS